MSHTIPKNYIAQFLPKNPVIVEAGAHIGRDTIKMAKQWPEGHIHAFEPVPALFLQLQESIKLFPNIMAYNVGLSDHTGQSLFYKSSGRSTATSSLLKPQQYATEFPDTFFEQITIQTITLDQWAAQYSIPHVDFFWFDMQGAELKALQGAQHVLSTVNAIYTEVAFEYRYENNPLYADISQWLAQQGFVIQKEAFGKKNWGNVLFVRKN